MARWWLVAGFTLGEKTVVTTLDCKSTGAWHSTTETLLRMCLPLLSQKCTRIREGVLPAVSRTRSPELVQNQGNHCMLLDCPLQSPWPCLQRSDCWGFTQGACCLLLLQQSVFTHDIAGWWCLFNTVIKEWKAPFWRVLLIGCSCVQGN